MKRLLLSLLLLAAVPPAAATAEPGELDPSFGSGGRVATPGSLGSPWSRARVQLAVGGEGRIAVGTESLLVVYREDGQLDAAFGTGGSVSISMPGEMRFDLSDLGVDPEGRVVAIGTAGTGSRSSAAILRYLPSGALDSSFGGDGIVVGKFGLRARSVVASLGKVDEEGRIAFVVGSRQRGYRCGGSRLLRRDRMVVRLTPEGVRDPSFGNLGLQDLQPLERVVAMATGPSGGFVFSGLGRRGCGPKSPGGLLRLRKDGSHIGRFGALTYDLPIASVAVDSRERIVSLFKAEPRPKGAEETTVARLLADGRVDRSFFGGAVGFEERGRYRWSTVAIQPGDRPILVGTLTWQRPRRSVFLVVPMLVSGRLDWKANWQGWAWKDNLGWRSLSVANEALIDPQGRLLVAGTVRRSRMAPGGGFALLRFELS